MIIITTLFYLSLLVIIWMTSRKLIELRVLKLSLVEGIEKELHGKLYDIIHKFWHIFRVKILARMRLFLLALFFTIAHEILHFTLIVGQKLKIKHSKWFDMVKGKGVIRKKGSVSFFLQDVAEYKKTLTTDNKQQTTEY